MTVSDEIRNRRHTELAECFSVIDTCLATYYAGARHMYRPVAGQLRILLCDRRPLLTRVFPTLAIGPLRPIEWLEPDQTELFDGSSARLTVQHSAGQQFRLARMPFLVTAYENGLQVADLEFDSGAQPLTLEDWMNQQITLHPGELSLRETIRSIANKGGGAHVDDKINRELNEMHRTGPAGVGVHVLFTIALGRFVQNIGLQYAQFRERFGRDGRLEDLVCDPHHATVRASAQVPDELESFERRQYVLTSLKRIHDVSGTRLTEGTGASS